ncbi:64_t:CDS:2 [Ambispora leptoticha]|uniref:64_t:CDS:1 n=1 Tax=Ambispora leptoticha TaxID=144679 RepID=A0A9N9FQ79_9GLOM|nr:64_t:CDS:2 [Ambispora leptoticha]
MAAKSVTLGFPNSTRAQFKWQSNELGSSSISNVNFVGSPSNSDSWNILVPNFSLRKCCTKAHQYHLYFLLSSYTYLENHHISSLAKLFASKNDSSSILSWDVLVLGLLVWKHQIDVNLGCTSAGTIDLEK